MNSMERYIVEVSGHQHLIVPGESFDVFKLPHQENELFEAVDLLSGRPVKLRVVKHFRGKKINGLKYKNKIHYLKRYGHRDELTKVVMVTEESVAPKAASKPAETVKKTATKTTATKKAAPKKSVKSKVKKDD